jgi:hypothetical protein
MVPDSSNPQSLNRFSYTRNNPLKYIDPTGHRETNGCDYEGCDGLRGSVYQRDGAAAPAEKFYRDCANGGGPECNSLHDVEKIVKGAGVAVATFVGGPAGLLGLTSYTVANGAVNWAKTGDIRQFFATWDWIDAGLSTVGGGLIGNLPAKAAPFLLGGQSAASDILHGDSPNVGKAVVNAGLGIASSVTSNILAEGLSSVKPIFSETASGVLNSSLSIATDSSVALAVESINDLPRQFIVGFTNFARPICLYTCR